MRELGFCLRGWFCAFLTWILEPTEDAKLRAEKRRKREQLRVATDEIERGSRRGR